MGKQTKQFELARQDMVQRQLARRDIVDARVLKAFATAPREQFVPAGRRGMAYEDQPLPIGHGQTISQPYTVALMLQELDARAEHKVLDVGAGSGYQTALLAMLARQVIAIERIADLADRAGAALRSVGAANVTMLVGDGSLGVPDEAPFDRIICGAAAPDVPHAWVEQLADGGRIVVPTGSRGIQEVLVVDKRDGRTTVRRAGGVRFVPLIGKQAWPE